MLWARMVALQHSQKKRVIDKGLRRNRAEGVASGPEVRATRVSRAAISCD